MQRMRLYVPGQVTGYGPDFSLLIIFHLRHNSQQQHVFNVCLQLITAKLCQIGANMPSSPDSSSDSSTGSPHHPLDGPNIEAEKCLPGVVSVSLVYIGYNVM